MRGPLRPVAPSLGDAAGRPRDGPYSKGPELPPSQETGEVRSRAIHFDRTGQPSTPAREGAEDKMKFIRGASFRPCHRRLGLHHRGRKNHRSIGKCCVPSGFHFHSRGRLLHSNSFSWPLSDSFRTRRLRPSRIFSFAGCRRRPHPGGQARNRASLRERRRHR